VTFTDEATLYLGGKEIRLRYLGPSHTDGDLAVYFPEWKTVCLGDMMAGSTQQNDTNPYVDYENGGTLKAWPASLDRALAFDVTEVVPGHGPIVGRDGLIAHRDKLIAIGKSLTEWEAEGKTAPQIRDLLISVYQFKSINLLSLDGLVAEYKQP
jgi:glyoxylase-like metal-dependent hydrolase (beta-lactamase superfamily II)